MGVWIEIRDGCNLLNRLSVTPCVGVWIEISEREFMAFNDAVTPCVGVWIEIRLIEGSQFDTVSPNLPELLYIGL